MLKTEIIYAFIILFISKLFYKNFKITELILGQVCIFIMRDYDNIIFLS